MEYEVDGSILHSKKQTKEDLEKGCAKDYQACSEVKIFNCKLNREDAVDHSK